MLTKIIFVGYLMLATFYLVGHLFFATLYLGISSSLFWMIDLCLLLCLYTNFYFFQYARSKIRTGWCYYGGILLSLVLHFHLVYLSVVLYSYSVSPPLPYIALIWGLFFVTLVSLGWYYLLRTLLFIPFLSIIFLSTLHHDVLLKTAFQFIHIPFNQSAWTSGFGRYWMLADLDKNHSLAQMSETEMINLLGKPRKESSHPIYFTNHYVVGKTSLGRSILLDYDEDAQQRIRNSRSMDSVDFCSDLILGPLLCFLF